MFLLLFLLLFLNYLLLLTSPSSEVPVLPKMEPNFLMHPDRYGSELPHEKIGVERSCSESDSAGGRRGEADMKRRRRG